MENVMRGLVLNAVALFCTGFLLAGAGNAADGQARKMLQEILAALGTGDAAAEASEALAALPDSAIDPGNARSLLLAWLAALPG